MMKFTSYLLITSALFIALVGCPAASETDKEKPDVVILTTSLGDIKIQLDSEKAPISSANFLGYVDDGFYEGTIFHRVIPDFMVQGGGMVTEMGRKDTKAPIKNEADNGLKNDRGTVAMARTQAKDSATSQFFINLKDNEFLNHGAQGFGYAVFGKVIDGMDVVDKIAGVSTGRHGPHGDVPKEEIVITSARRE